MQRTLSRLILGIALASLGWAEEPVIRVIDAKSKSVAPVELAHRKPGDAQWYPAYVGTRGEVKDQFKTGPNTVAALEFFIGGRVAVVPGSEIEIVTDHSIANKTSLKRVLLKSGGLWMKSSKLKEPLEIQTNGGVMGIKGTEFTVEAVGEHTTLSVLEGSVEVSDQQRQLLGYAEPGDVYQIHRGAAPKIEHVDPEVLRQTVLSGNLGEAYQLVEQEFKSIREKTVELETHEAFSAIDRILRKGEQTSDSPENATPRYHLAPPYKQSILQPPSTSSIRGLQPSASAEAFPLFRWQEFPQADGYVIFVAADARFEQILFSARTREAQALYPSSSRPLATGQYFWRVVPVNANDQPLQGAAQATFQVGRSS
jgi:hypothetical protein